MQTKPTYNQLISIASEHFLTEPLPVNFNSNPQWNDEDLDQFIEDHTWEAIEHLDVETIWSLIANVADDLAKVAGIEKESAEEKESYVCPACGSESIESEAKVYWDTDAQDWVITEILDNRVVCPDCHQGVRGEFKSIKSGG